jgi:hypothetical protein
MTLLETSVLPVSAALPGAGELREIAAREGIDVATTRLFRALLASPLHGPFIHRVAEICRAAAPFRWHRDVSLVIVPGAFYREHPRSGADGRLVREQAERLGCPTELVPLASTGTLRDNARTICDWLLRQPARPMILASLSKGGADVKVALSQPEAGRAFQHVIGWISLSGILAGTPMADWVLSPRLGAALTRLYYRLRGEDLRFLRELRYGSGLPLDFALRLPTHVRLISIVGFPLREHLSRGISRRCHRRLSSLGPNDGGLVLADVCALPGLVYPVWGADHYLQPAAEASVLVSAVLQYLSETL